MVRAWCASLPADLVRKGELEEISWAKDPSPSQDTQSRSEEEMNTHCAGSMGLGGQGRPASTKRPMQAGWQGTSGEDRGTAVGT